MFQRGRDQLVDILSGIGGRQVGVSTINLLIPAWGPHAYGQHTFNFSHLIVVSVSAKQLKGFDSEYYPQFLRNS